MADANANIRIDVDTSDALSQIKALQRQISLFHTSMRQSGKAAAAQSAKMQASLVNGINATQGFSAQMVNIKTATESFTNSLEKNKFSMGQYFRYAGASTKTFGKLFKSEFETIGKVARERVKDLQTQYIKMGRDANGAMKAIKVRPTTLDLKDLGTQTAIAAQKQQLFNQLIKQGSTNLLNWGKNTQWAGRQLMVGFTIPLTIMGATASREFMKLEEQAIRFKRVYGDMFTSNKETEQALENVRELAREFTKFGVSVEETIGLAASVAQMGAMGEDLKNQVTEATRLAVLGGIEQQEALDTTISLTNAFGLATDKLAGKIAFLNAAENQTILSIEDFNEAIPKAGSVVNQLGGDVEDLAYFLTAMREGGINASQSANALKSSLARLINPTEVSQEKLASFGIDILGIVNDNAGNLKKTIQVLAVELDKLDPLNKSRALEQLFGKFQFARMSTLFENIVKEGSQANKILELTTNSTEELSIIAERELGRVSDSPMYKFRKAIEEFQVALAPIGEAFLKLATPVIEFGNKVMEQFNSLSDGTKQFITGAVAIGGVVAPALIMVVGLLANGLANTIKFGALVSNALRGASQSSNVLTEQFNYMNSEQIEAAAVAASLDQVHAKLRQTFTAEAAAVDKLTAAYTRAISKQKQMQMGAAGKAGKAPKGYNQGVKSVPGPKGAGDIVPAMLAPGEAVIPAKKARKYSGLIDAIFNDRLPGYRFGLNPFAGMMSRSRVVTRMPSQSFFTALGSKDMRYKSAFETGTGADYLTKHGLPNKAQAQLRMRMEKDFMGIPATAPNTARPTYGAVGTTSLVARLLNMILGGRRGVRFNAATNPMSSSLDKYGDIALVGKRGLNARSQAFAGDSLLQYSRFPQAMMPGGARSAMPMRGASSSQMQAAGMDAFNYVPGSTTKLPGGGMRSNPKIPYIESYTSGGFNFNEIDKIIAKDPAMRKQLKEQLRSAGLKGVKVQGEGFAASLFRALGVPGFKDGILSIPGSGNEDKFPAMLAPGEAVIPAKQAKKYSGFIEQMIAGNIPGFKKGRKGRFQASHIMGPLDPNNPAVMEQVLGFYPDLTPDQMKNMEILGDATMDLPDWMNQDMRPSTNRSQSKNMKRGIDPDVFEGSANAIDNKLLNTAKVSAEDMGLKLSEETLAGLSNGLEKDITKRAADLARQSGSKVTDEILAQATDQVLTEAEKKGGNRGKLATGIRGRANSVSAIRTKFSGQGSEDSQLRQLMAQGKVAAQKGKRGGTELYFIDDKGKPIAKAGRFREAEHREAAADFYKNASVNEHGMYVDGSGKPILPPEAAAMRGTSVEKSSVRGKPSYSSRKKNMVAKIKNIAAMARDEAVKAFTKQAKETAKTASPSKRTKKVAKDTVDGYVNELEKGKKKATTAAKKQNQAQLKAEENFRKRSEAARKGWETRRANQEAAAMAAPAAAAASRRRGRMAGMAAKFRGMGGRMAMAGGGLTSAAMMASMVPGKVGETAQKLMMPMMALSMVIPMLTSGIGVAVVALGALAAGIMLANSSFKKTQEESMRLTEAMGGGSQAIENFAKAAGKVSAGEVMDKRRENALGVFQIQPGKGTFGESFMGSQAGEDMRNTVSESLKTLGTDGTQQMITNQLATAVASGAMSTEQARSVIASLSKELNNASFGIAVNSELTNLLGPQGENLLEDPLGIRLQILDESQDKLEKSFINLGDVAGRTFNDNLATNMGVLASAGAGAAGGAVIGGLIGSVVPVVGNLVGAGIGAVVGTVGGAIAGGLSDLGGFIGSKVSGDPSRKDRIANASGASVAMAKIALQQQQEMVDSLELEYEKRIANAEAAGDLEEVERLTNQRIEDRARLLEENRQLVASIQSGFTGATPELQGALMSGADKQMENQYKDTALADVVPLARDLIEGEVEDKEVQYMLKMQVASGEIDPMQMYDFLTRFDKGSVEQDAIVNMIAESGGAFANQTMGLMSLFEDKAIQSDILLNMQATGDAQEAAELLSFYQALSQTDAVLDREAKFRFVLDNPTQADQLQKRIEDIKGLSEEDLTAKAYVEVLNSSQLEAVNKDLEYFNTLSPEMKKIYLQSLVTVSTVTTADSEEFRSWLAENPMMSMGATRDQQLQAFATAQARKVTKMAEDTTGQNAPPSGSTGSGSGPKASAFDGLLTKLRDVRDASISVKKGFKAATAELDKLFKGGKNSIDVFDGLANQMRRLGAGQGMIEMVLGMDPDEYEDRKDELFNFDKNGKITGLTQKFKSLAAAVSSIAIGDYVNSQEQFISNTNDQFTAINKLVGAGMSFVDAYDMVADQALATAIATAATTEEMEKLLEISELLNETNDRKETVDAEAQAVKAVKRTNEEFRERYLALQKISKEGSGLSDNEIKAILSDPNLAKLYLNPSLDPRTLEQRLRQAEAQANLELRLKVATEEGKEAIFDEAMGEINDQFARKEQEIEIDFKLATEEDSDIVRDAQNKIAAIQFEIDDYQAQLKGITDQEDEINDRYDKRYEALDKVATAQEQIARSQKAQLDIADALSRGDIAAAARAQQQLREQEAEKSREEQRAQLERQQEAELANVRSASGKSREELEDAIKSKKDEIFNIEESELEPAQERIRQAEYAKEVAIDNLEIQGRTRDMWEKISNQVDLATVNAEEFANSIERALALYEYFVNGKPLDLALFGEGALEDLVNNYGVNPEDTYDSGDEDDDDGPTIIEVIPEDVVDAIETGGDIDEDKLTARQLAAKNLYEVLRDQEGTKNMLREQLGIDDPARASLSTLKIAQDLGIIDKDTGRMNMTADRAEAVMQQELDRRQKELQIKREQDASRAYAEEVYGGSVSNRAVSADRLDRAYQRDISSQGLTTNVGKTTAQIAQEKADARRRDEAKASAEAARAENARREAERRRAAEAAAQKRRDEAKAAAARAQAEQARRAAAAREAEERRKRAAEIAASKKAFENSGMSLRAYMRSAGGSIPGYSVGGRVKGYSFGGFAKPLGSDNVPAMLTPGEFVIRRPAVQSIGMDKLEKMNDTGTYNDGSVYNYNLAVNVSSTADPDKIANTVMREIKRVESQRVRGNRF